MSAVEPRPKFRHRRPWLFRSAVGMLLGALLVVAGLAWLLATSSGAAFLLAGAGLTAEGLQGSLLGPLNARRLEYRRTNLLVTVENPAFEWSPLGLLSGELRIAYLTADALDFAAATPATKEKAQLPVTLKPPLDIRVEKASVKRIGIATLEVGGNTKPRFEITGFELDSVAGADAWRFKQVNARTPAGLVVASGSIGALSPFPVDVTAHLTGEREGRAYRLMGTAKGTLSRFEAVLKGEEGGITGSATASIEPLEDQPVKRVVGKLQGIDVNAFAPAAPHTNLAVELDLAPARDGAFAGPVRLANALPGAIDQQRVPVTAARGTIRILAPRYELTQATLAFANGGSAQGDIRVDGSATRAKLTVAGVDLAAWHTKLRPTKLSGEIRAETTPKAQRFEVNLQDPRFQVAGRAGIENQVLTVEEARLASGKSVALVQGTLGLAGRQPLDFKGSLAHVDPSAFAADLPAGDLNGRASVKGTLAGGMAGDLGFDLFESRLAGLTLTGRGVVTGDTKRVSRVDVDLTLADARVQAKGAFGQAGDQLQVKLDAPELGPVARAFKQDFAGRLEADATLTGTFAAPAGKLAAKGEKLRVPGGIAMQSLDARVEVGGAADARVDGKVDVVQLTRTTAGAAETLAEKGTVTLVGTRANHRATLDAVLPPDKVLSVLPPSTTTVSVSSPAAPARQVARRVQLTLAGGLVEKAKAPTWQGRVEAFELQGPNPLVLVAPATLTLARDLVELGEAIVRGDIGRARFTLTRWTPTLIEAKGSSNGFLTRTIVRALGLPGQARSSLVLAAEWDIRAAETLEGFVRVKRTGGDIRIGEPAVALGLETFEANVEAARGQVQAMLAIRGKQVGRIEAKATTTIRREGAAWSLPKGAPLSGSLEADVPTLAWASDWLGPDARLDAKVAARIAVAGTLAEPSLRGTLTADALQLRDSTLGFEIDEGRIALALRDREVAIERFELASAWRLSPVARERLENLTVPDKGTISATGRLDFAKGTGTITVKSQAYPVSQLPARFLAATGEAKLESSDGGLSLVGSFRADAGYIGLGASASPRPSDDVLVDRGEGAEEKKAQRFNLDIRFQPGERLYFEGRGLVTRLAGDIRLRGDPGRTLAASGQIRTVRGNYDAYGQKLLIERGVLTFQGPIDNPTLNVLAVRQGENLPVVAGVEVVGTVSRPQVRLYSRPDVPDPEKLAWLVLGRGPGEASEGDAATLFAAANALLGVGTENRKLVRQLGFDDVSIGRSGVSALGMPKSSIAGKTGSTVGNETVTVGKRLTKDLYVSYQQGLADAESSVRFAYQVTRRLQLLLIAGDKPGMDAVYRFTFGRERAPGRDRAPVQNTQQPPAEPQ
jgi:translocation and assembly module TamB